MKVEEFCTPKQLGDKLRELGIPGFNLRQSRSLVSDMKQDGKYTIIRGNSVRPSEARAFLEVNPSWKPFGKKGRK